MWRNGWMIGVIVVLLTAFSISFGGGVSTPPSPMLVVGKVVWVKGVLNATRPDKKSRMLAKAGPVYLHDMLTTDAKTQAQIVFTDNTLMTFRPGTKFYIDHYDYHPKNVKGSVGTYVMKLLEGGFRTITGLIAKANPSDYRVNTPVATIGVRGTDYTVSLQGTQLFVGYYAGSPCVTSGGTLCLSKTTPYANVPSMGAAPVPLTQQPAVFNEKTPIVETTFKATDTGSNNSTSSGTGIAASSGTGSSGSGDAGASSGGSATSSSDSSVGSSDSGTGSGSTGTSSSETSAATLSTQAPMTPAPNNTSNTLSSGFCIQ